MEKLYLRVPEGMSYVNAFYALYLSATTFEEDKITCIRAEDVATAEKVFFVFRNFPDYIKPKYFIDCEGGRSIKVNFETFPILEVSKYDQIYGIGAAELALKQYNERVSSRDRFDKWDLYRFLELDSDERDEKSWG